MGRSPFSKSIRNNHAAIASGCLRADLTWDWTHGFVEVFNPVLAQGRAELGPTADDWQKNSQRLRYAEVGRGEVGAVTEERRRVRIGGAYAYSTLHPIFSLRC